LYSPTDTHPSEENWETMGTKERQRPRSAMDSGDAEGAELPSI